MFKEIKVNHWKYPFIQFFLLVVVFFPFVWTVASKIFCTRYPIRTHKHWNKQFKVHSTLFTRHKSLTLDPAIILNFTISNDISSLFELHSNLILLSHCYFHFIYFESIILNYNVRLCVNLYVHISVCAFQVSWQIKLILTINVYVWFV